MKKYYFYVHVTIPKVHGYSIGVVLETSCEPNEDDVIAHASDCSLFEDFEDRDYVDVVEEITEADYKLLCAH